MKFKIDYGYVSIGMSIISLEQLNRIKSQLNNPTTLVRYGAEINPDSYDVLVTQNAKFSGTWNTGSGHLFGNLFEAINYHLSHKAVKPKINKMYRFIYNAGSRAGMKRAAIIDEVSSSYVIARDLDTGETRNYSLSKISELEEIKV